ncbi:MAG: tetratricopeptide repeat protein, partial [Planctomycetota bacterium]
MSSRLVRQFGLFLILALAGNVFSTAAFAQEAGDRVVVMVTTKTKIRKDIVDEVYGGSIHTIIAVNDKWCALDDVRGWLPLQRVMNLDGAKEQYDERIEDNANDWEAFATRGMIYRELDQVERAIADLTRSLQINPQNANTWSNTGVAFKDAGQYDLAIQHIEKAIELSEQKSPHAYFNLGMVLYAMNR